MPYIDTARLDALAVSYIRNIVQKRPYMTQQELVYFWQAITELAHGKAREVASHRHPEDIKDATPPA